MNSLKRWGPWGVMALGIVITLTGLVFLLVQGVK